MQYTNPIIYQIYLDLKVTEEKVSSWPASSPFEVAVGSVLVQNANWSKTLKVVKGLKEHNLLSPYKFVEAEEDHVKSVIKSIGYYNQKYERLVLLSRFIINDLNGDLSNLANYSRDEARNMLLGIKGIGEETADVILLYGARIPAFVIDNYTKRILSRIGVTDEKDYRKLQKLFEDNLPQDVYVYDWYHWYLDELGALVCKSDPLCWECELENYCKKMF